MSAYDCNCGFIKGQRGVVSRIHQPWCESVVGPARDERMLRAVAAMLAAGPIRPAALVGVDRWTKAETSEEYAARLVEVGLRTMER